jgi:NAD(P)-dependent dehydrogenase (short-subunit alcohol dehydrogenase family)
MKGKHMSEVSKIALITGANKGIGFEIARQLGAQGITILVGARDQARGEAAVEHLRAQGINARALHLDVTRQATIDAAAALIEQTYGKLDILVNNAGVNVDKSDRDEGTPTPPSQVTVEDLREIFETNVFGVFAVTKAMLPLLRRSEAGRIVNLSSEMGSMSWRSDPTSEVAQYPPSLAYDASKAAVNSLTVSFAKELRDTPIKINAVGPGYVSTDINYHRGYLTPEQGARAPVAFATLPADGPSGGFFKQEGVIPW